MPDENGHFTYAEWENWAVDKIANAAFRWEMNDETARESYVRIQVQAMLRQALRHGRSGLGNNDLVVRNSN
jgi:hypothetical protein